MGQNIEMPNLEVDQCGNVYYMSLINFLSLSVSNNSRVSGMDDMSAYIWQEKDGRYGANNSTSCLLKDFENRRFLQQRRYRSLTLVADNYGGKNKNKTVLQFLM